MVHRPDRAVLVAECGQMLLGEDTLPDLAIAVDEFFALILPNG